MALRLRRGTDAERLLITPAEGELIYVTDFQTANVSPLWIGNGTTVGGNPVDTTAFLELNTQSISDLNDVNVGQDSTVPEDGDILSYDSTSSEWRASNLTLNSLKDVITDSTLPNDGDFIAFDAGSNEWRTVPANVTVDNLSDLLDVNIPTPVNGDTIVYNSSSGQYEASQFLLSNLNDVDTGASLNNNVLVYNSILGRYEAKLDLNNNIIDSNGDIILDAATGVHTGNLVGDINGSVYSDGSSIIIDGTDGTLYTNLIISSDITVRSNLDATSTLFDIESKDEGSDFRLMRTSTSDISGDAVQYGRFLFGREDVNGTVETVSLSGYQDGFALSHDTNGTHISPSLNMFVKDGQFAFGTFAPATNAKVDVAGNLHVTGGYTQFGSLTYLERDALTPAAGMVIWNSDSSQFEGYDGSNWINLVDGSTSTAP